LLIHPHVLPLQEREGSGGSHEQAAHPADLLWHALPGPELKVFQAVNCLLIAIGGVSVKRSLVWRLICQSLQWTLLFFFPSLLRVSL